MECDVSVVFSSGDFSVGRADYTTDPSASSGVCVFIPSQPSRSQLGIIHAATANFYSMYWSFIEIYSVMPPVYFIIYSSHLTPSRITPSSLCFYSLAFATLPFRAYLLAVSFSPQCQYAAFLSLFFVHVPFVVVTIPFVLNFPQISLILTVVPA